MTGNYPTTLTSASLPWRTKFWLPRSLRRRSKTLGSGSLTKIEEITFSSLHTINVYRQMVWPCIWKAFGYALFVLHSFYVDLRHLRNKSSQIRTLIYRRSRSFWPNFDVTRFQVSPCKSLTTRLRDTASLLRVAMWWRTWAR